MIMTKVNRTIERGDLIASDEYAKNRKQFRKELVEFKKNRRISVGPYATFYFESFETILGQIQEMLHIEKGGEEQLKDELNAYNPLIPKGKELIATLMFEIDDADRRDRELRRLTGVERKIELRLGKSVVHAIPEDEVNRTKADGKTSSIHFVRFPLGKALAKSFPDKSQKLELAVTHSNYGHVAVISDEARNALAADLE